MCKNYEKEPERLWESNPGRPSRTIRLANPDGEGEDYEVEVPLAQWDYAHIVSRIIKARYDDDQREAISFNYQNDPTDEEHSREMDELQAWRANAKEVARRILGME